MKAWHYAQIGLLMELKVADMSLNEKVEKATFQGIDCLAITLKYEDGKTKGDFYKGSNWTIYLDPSNYSMKGFKEEGVMNIYVVCSGILDISGVKVPICKTIFYIKDNSFYLVDLITLGNGI